VDFCVASFTGYCSLCSRRFLVKKPLSFVFFSCEAERAYNFNNFNRLIEVNYDIFVFDSSRFFVLFCEYIQNSGAAFGDMRAYSFALWMDDGAVCYIFNNEVWPADTGACMEHSMDNPAVQLRFLPFVGIAKLGSQDCCLNANNIRIRGYAKFIVRRSGKLQQSILCAHRKLNITGDNGCLYELLIQARKKNRIIGER